MVKGAALVLAAVALQVGTAQTAGAPKPVQVLTSPTLPGYHFADLRRAPAAAPQARTSPPLPQLRRPPSPVNAALLAAAIRGLRPAPAPTPTPTPDPAPPAPLPTPTSTLVTLTPAETYIAGKGGIFPEWPAWITGDLITLRPAPCVEPRLNFYLNASATTLLLDFEILAMWPGSTFKVAAPRSATQALPIPASNDRQHLVVAVTLPPRAATDQEIDWVVRLSCDRDFTFWKLTAYATQ